jgi:hypothetical protein
VSRRGRNASKLAATSARPYAKVSTTKKINVFGARLSTRSAAATDWGIVHAEATGAAGLHHRHHSVATSLNHFAGVGIAASANHHYSLLGHLEPAHAHGHVAVHHHHAVHHHATADHAATEHRTKILQHPGRHLVLAITHHFHAAIAFFHFHGAAGDDHHVHTGSSGHGWIHGHARHHHLSFHRHHKAVFLEKIGPFGFGVQWFKEREMQL